MSVTRVEVTDLGELAKALERLANEWDNIVEKAMADALSATGYFDEVWQRTPKSSRERYASRWRAVAARLDISHIGDDNDPASWVAELPSGWERYAMQSPTDRRRGPVTFRDIEGTRARDRREAAIRRVSDYGQERLANSLLPYGVDGKSRNLAVRRRQGVIELVLSSSVPYAARMHEATKPGEGEYWTPGRMTGWSASRTGNRYLEKPYEDLQDKIMRELGYQLDRALKSMGLM